MVGKRVDFGLVAAVLEVDQRIAGDLVGERAAVAEDAPLTIEEHDVADGIGFSKWRFSSTKRDSPGPYA